MDRILFIGIMLLLLKLFIDVRGHTRLLLLLHVEKAFDACIGIVNRDLSAAKVVHRCQGEIPPYFSPRKGR